MAVRTERLRRSKRSAQAAPAVMPGHARDFDGGEIGTTSAFQELLAQLSSEYERVELALADTIAELRVGQGRDVRGAVGWQDEHRIKCPRGYNHSELIGSQGSEAEEEEREEEGEQHELVCERGWSQVRELTSPVVERTPTIELVAEEGLGLAVFPVAAANVPSRGASGPPPSVPILAGSAPTHRGVARERACRQHLAHSTSRLSAVPHTGARLPEGVARCQGAKGSVCRQDTWEAYMNVEEGRSNANKKFDSPRHTQGVKARIGRLCASGVGAQSDEPRLIESEPSTPSTGRLTLRTFQVASRWAINPEASVALEKWDQITMVAVAYVALVTPVQVSMMEAKLDAMFFVNCVIDFVFFSDMILQFFLMYPQHTHGVHSFEYRHPKIIARYLKTWFAIDFVSIVPVDLFAVLSNFAGGQQLKIVKAVRLMRLLKLFRVLRASRVFHRFETRMSITYGSLAMLKFFVMLSVISHWLANLWALTLVIVDESEGIPRWVDTLTDLEAHVEVKTKDSPAKLYIACLYFTSYTITSVGYGDIGPKNISERVVLTFIVIVSGISWAVILGEVCSIVSNLDKDEQAFRSTMDELNAMMQDSQIPGPMRTRLRSFFLSNKNARKKALHFKIVSAMSPGLRGEVSWEINRFWLHKVSFLRPLLELEEVAEQQDTGSIRSLRPFVFDMSLMMEQVVCAQGEAFGVPHTMYILNRGLVNRRNRVFRLGAVWGSDFVLSDRRLLEPVDSHSLTYVELTTLNRQHFLDLVQRHSMSFPEIYRVVRRYCCWLAFQRALLIEARRRQALLRGKMEGIIDITAPVRRLSGVRPFPLPPAPPLTP